MPSAGLCVRYLLYLTLIIYCPENFIIIFIKKSLPSNRIPILVFDNRMFERVPRYSLPSLIYTFYLLAWSNDHVSHWNNMSTFELLFH
jgi:hypothetical protein